jgi:hypothetical protein
MKEHLKGVGALIGLVGAQIFTLLFFAVKAEPCESTSRLLPAPGQECVWGMTMGEYWAKFGTGMSAFFVVVGFIWAAVLEES